MTSIISWNIQCGLGCDGEYNLTRIADNIHATGDSDVICLQEVCRFMPELDAGEGEDQVEILAALFPGYETLFGAAINQSDAHASNRRQFGNLILSRLPVLQVFFHPLPQPHDVGIKHMPRQLSEVVVGCASGPLRILTTHLEYHSTIQRLAQVNVIHDLHAQVCDNISWPGLNPGSGLYNKIARPETTVLCGDFNFTPDSTEYQQLLSAFGLQTSPLRDAWRVKNRNMAHAPTCGIFDKRQWPEGPHTRDFFFISDDLCPKIKDMIVNTKTDASDHQPLLLDLCLTSTPMEQIIGIA